MLIQRIDYFLVVWFVLALASTLYVGWDSYRNNPELICSLFRARRRLTERMF